MPETKDFTSIPPVGIPPIFTDYPQNRSAQSQLLLIQTALANAGYRVRRDRNYPDVWHVRRKDSLQNIATLFYDGFGNSIGRWWKIAPGIIPSQVFDIVMTCVR